MQPLHAIAAIIPLVAEFERLGIRYYVGGSLASSLYGLARTTLDADIVADLARRHVAPLIAALKNDYYVSEPMILDAIARKSCFNLIYLSTSFKVDVFVSKGRPYDTEVFQRIRQDSLQSGDSVDRFFFASAEDTVLAKLEWYRLGDEISDRQWRDVLEVLKAQQNVLDRTYLARWAGQLRVADLLEKAWREVES